MLEPLEWDEEEGPTKETVVPRRPSIAGRSRPSAGGLRVIRSAPSLDEAPLTEREVAPATVCSPPADGASAAPPPVIEIVEAEAAASVGALYAHDSDMPPSAIRSVAPALLSVPLPLLSPEAARDAMSCQASNPRASTSYPPAAPTAYPVGPTLAPPPHPQLDASLLVQEVTRLRRGLLVSLVVASAALTLSLVLAVVLLLQLTSRPDTPAPEQTAPAARGPQRV